MTPNRTMGTFLWLVLPVSLAFAGAALGQVKHPRLFVTAQRIQEIRQAVQQAGSTHAEAMKLLKARVDKGEEAYNLSSNYRHAYMAVEAATAHLVTGDSRYSDLAFEAVKRSCEGPATPTAGSGLARAMMSKGVGIAYDWCHGSWSDSQRQWAQGKINQALDAWPSFSHSNLGGNRASNWAGVCRGGELILLLAAGEEAGRADRYKMLKGEMKRHIESAYSTASAWCNEGASYLDYAGQFVVPAVLALRSVGDSELDKAFDARPFWKLMMFCRSFAKADAGSVWQVPSGVDSTSVGSEGYLSLLLGATPKESLPYYCWFYDRNMGRLSQLDPDKRYDWDRAGTAWCLVYYPEKVQAQDPTGKLKPYLPDEAKGVFYFRNRWKDADDVLFLGVSNNKNEGGWNLPEALQINLTANGQAIFGGPGKDGVGGKNPDKFSKLIVDGKIENDRGGKSTFTPSDSGGCVVLDGGECYRKSGVEVKRHVLVHMGVEPSTAIVATVDDIKADADHQYAYNLAVSNPRDDGGIKVEAGAEAGRPVFTMTAPTGGYCKGWVLAPESAALKAGDPTSAETSGKSLNIFVVMFTGKGTPPQASITGQGMDSVIKVGNLTVRWDSAKGCITCQ